MQLFSASYTLLHQRSLHTYLFTAIAGIQLMAHYQSHEKHRLVSGRGRHQALNFLKPSLEEDAAALLKSQLKLATDDEVKPVRLVAMLPQWHPLLYH